MAIKLMGGAGDKLLAMVSQLAQGETVFDFCAQLQTDADSMPIEDLGKERWEEK